MEEEGVGAAEEAEEEEDEVVVVVAEVADEDAVTIIITAGVEPTTEATKAANQRIEIKELFCGGQLNFPALGEGSSNLDPTTLL